MLSPSHNSLRSRLANGRLFNYLKEPFNRTAAINYSGDITIVPKQIYILPTRFGLIFAVMLIAMLVGSNNYGINLGYMLTFILSGIGFSAMLQTWRNLVNLEITPGIVEPVYCGETAIFQVHCHNRRPSNRSAIQLMIGEHHTVFDLLQNQSVKVECPMTALSRGYLIPGRWTATSYFPLSMFYAWAYFETSQKCLVYPKPVSGEIPLDQIFKSDNRNGIENDDNIDFFGHRKYQPGDSLKRLDWKALARGRGYLIKHFTRNVDDDIWLNWSEIHGDNTEEKLSILCRVVIELSRIETRFGLSMPGVSIAPDNGHSHKKDCLKALALFNL